MTPTDARSPLVSATDIAAQVAALPEPGPHTDAGLATVLHLLTRQTPRTVSVAVGHSRDTASRDAALAFTAAWTARSGRVLAVVDWPEAAASWLRAATRLTAQTPDAWVVAAAPLGFAQLARRLRASTGFDPARTVAFASLCDPRLAALAGPGTLDGLRGARPDGGTWEVHGGWVTSYPAQSPVQERG